MQDRRAQEPPSRFRPILRPAYGIDAPGVVRNFLIAGFGAIAAGVFTPAFYIGVFKLSLVGPTLLAIGCVSLGLCASMLAYSIRGKFNIRDIMLKLVRWRGDEAVLDVGTGRGLIAIGAAKRLQTGTVTGIDIWSDADLSGNTLENAQHNVECEGVQSRVQLLSHDARDIGFVDESFDVVLSLFCLHTIAQPEGRDAACREIARVLKRRGVAVIADNANLADYVRSFEAAGLRAESPKFYVFEAYAIIGIVVARKR